MKCPKHWPRPRLWIVKTHLFIERFIPISIFASALMFAIPLTITGIVITRDTSVVLFTRGVVFALAWLAIAPWLLTLAYRTVAEFFDNNRPKFMMDDKAFQDLQHKMLQDLGSPKYLMISIPLAIICVLVLLNSLYSSMPLLVRIWSIVTFSILFFVGGMGFWGISRFNVIFEEICKQELKFDPYHADGFGGLTFLGQFNVKGPQFFFSGALLFPIVVEVTHYLPNDELVSLGLWGVVATFLIFGLAGFLIPQIKIKDIIARSKERCLSQSESFLQALLTNLCVENCDNKEKAEIVQLKIDVYYQYFHKRIMAVKEWPFDWKIILEILSSLTVPAAVVIYEYFLH